MSESLLVTVLPFVLMPLLTVVIVYFAIKMERKQMNKVINFYKLYADKFGLSYFPESKGILWNYTYPYVYGKLDNFEIKLYSYKTGGKNKTTYTDLSIYYQGNLEEFKIARNKLFQKIGKAFGAQDIVIGNPELDELYVFKSKDEAFLQGLIDRDVQELLIHLKSFIVFPLEAKKGRFNHSLIGHMDTEQKLENFEKLTVLMLKILKKI
ncbi:MAG: hypothetical protein R2772_06575 [Chitinophagales bacterium]